MVTAGKGISLISRAEVSTDVNTGFSSQALYIEMDQYRLSKRRRA
jgi:hypothetical protein